MARIVSKGKGRREKGKGKREKGKGSYLTDQPPVFQLEAGSRELEADT
jgi:hypothetical protein